MKSILLGMLLTISLSASTDTVFSDINNDDQPDIAQLKENYIINTKYATYTIIMSLLGYRLFYETSFRARELSLFCANISSVVGLANGAKWLFLHLFPHSTAADINAINTLDKLIYAVLALQLPQKYESYRSWCSKLEYWNSGSY